MQTYIVCDQIIKTAGHQVKSRVSQRGPSALFGSTERFSGGHKLRPLLDWFCNSSAVILQNQTKIDIFTDEQGATSVESLWKGVTNHESLTTTGQKHREDLETVQNPRLSTLLTVLKNADRWLPTL